MMKPWQKNVHLIASIGGGFAGFLTTFIPFGQQPFSVGLLLLVLLFMSLFGYGIYAGLKFAANTVDDRSLLIFYALQIPWLTSPVLSYQLASVGQITFGFRGFSIHAQYYLGSNWFCSVFQPNTFGLGVNFLALGLFIFLLGERRKRALVGLAATPRAEEGDEKGEE